MSYKIVRATLALSVCLAGLSIGLRLHAQQNVCRPPNRLVRSMYFLSKPQDEKDCALQIVQGKIVVSPSVSNPSMSCPDMFAWKLFAEAVQADFWKNWATDDQMWPQHPLPKCGPGERGTTCCDTTHVITPKNPNKPEGCPYFPGYRKPSIFRPAVLPSKAHLPTFLSPLKLQELFMANEPDPGKRVREAADEIVFRNKPMFDYIYENDLYNQEGLMRVFEQNASNIGGGAPYRAVGGKALVEIDLPIDSVMIKSNWITKDLADEVGLKEDPNNPYIKMYLVPPNGSKPIEHWLVSFHISSKDIPDWVWATFEHVNNPGRCDYTGCNDSYGYTSDDVVQAEQARNYTAPNTKCDELKTPDYIFDVGKTYPGGRRSAGLQQIFTALHIGTTDDQCNQSSCVPTSTSRAWLSYRLKGAQVQFTDSTGRPTHLGNSITEGGFVGSSSCISCHARASITRTGTVPASAGGEAGLGVFTNDTNEAGFFQSYKGSPDPDWFFVSSNRPILRSLQTDFIWGFLAAKCVSNDPTQCIQAAGIQPPVNLLQQEQPTPAKKQPVTVRERVREQ